MSAKAQSISWHTPFQKTGKLFLLTDKTDLVTVRIFKNHNLHLKNSKSLLPYIVAP
jgi:hypothetical protein